MIAIGILCMIFGGVLCVVGNSVNNDVEARMESFFSDGVTNPGSTYVTIGILLLVVGGILLLVGAIMRANRNNSSTSDRSSGNNCQQNVQNNMSRIKTSRSTEVLRRSRRRWSARIAAVCFPRAANSARFAEKKCPIISE